MLNRTWDYVSSSFRWAATVASAEEAVGDSDDISDPNNVLPQIEQEIFVGMRAYFGDNHPEALALLDSALPFARTGLERLGFSSDFYEPIIQEIARNVTRDYLGGSGSSHLGNYFMSQSKITVRDVEDTRRMLISQGMVSNVASRLSKKAKMAIVWSVMFISYASVALALKVYSYEDCTPGPVGQTARDIGGALTHLAPGGTEGWIAGPYMALIHATEPAACTGFVEFADMSYHVMVSKWFITLAGTSVVSMFSGRIYNAMFGTDEEVTVPPNAHFKSAIIRGCATCGRDSTSRCSACKSVGYCSAACQRKDWSAGHSAKCAGQW
jgi:hypothetical protein